MASASVRFLRTGPATGELIGGRLLDASASGLRVEADSPLAVGDRLLIEARAAGVHVFNATAEVVWVRPSGGGRHEAGCEFRVDLSRRQTALLRRLAAGAGPVDSCAGS